ncbi:MAG: hypothetical protein AMK72_11300 [Planctomycetes bacterium SM23_25]|nr:MAG: hypothetical protein AMK72_11300 [Planctomycetes bacterium SM23_25]
MSACLLALFAAPGSALGGATAAVPDTASRDWTEVPAAKVTAAWRHLSPTSAVLYWQTNGRARSFVEYGPTPQYGQRTQASPEPGFAHFHRLRGLKTGAAYHYRLICVRPDGTKIVGQDAVLAPKALGGAIPVPGTLAGPPYVLDKPRATYVLTRDITTEGPAIVIRAEGITLDLDGHTVTYGTRREEINVLGRTDAKGRGVAWEKLSGIRLLNGTVRQGSATNRAHAVCIAGGSAPELAGLTLVTRGDSVGVFSQWGFQGGRIHHNRFVDAAAGGIRQGGFWNPRSCISVGATGVRIAHNLLQGTFRLIRVRSAGGMNDDTGAEVFENDLLLDARHFLAVAITASLRGGVVRDNRIVCRGVPATAVMLPTCAGRYSRVHGNRILVRPDRVHEPGRSENAPACDLCTGIAATGGVYGLSVHENTIVVDVGPPGEGDGGSDRRAVVGNGMRFVNMMFDNTNVEVRDNDVRACAGAGAQAVCVVVTGGSQANTLVLRGNRLASDTCCVAVSDRVHSTQAKGEQDGGRNARFVGNTLVRLGRRQDFVSIRCGNEETTSTAFFLDTVFEGGAGWQHVSFVGKGRRELRVGKTARLAVQDEQGRPIEGARLILRAEKPARQYVAGYSDHDGKAELPVVAHLLTPAGQAQLEGVKLVVSKEGFRRAELPAGRAGGSVTLKEGLDEAELLVREMRQRFPDKRAQEGEWDWLHAPLTKVTHSDIHVSVTSACVYWQTDGRSWGYVEYGPTKRYGRHTEPLPKPNFAHLHHLRGLESGREYHYRLISTGADGKRIVAEDMTFTAKLPDGATAIGRQKGLPLVISRPGRYRLVRDLTAAEGDVIVIKSAGVTLDLDGHTITYGAAAPPARPARGIVCEAVRAGGPRILNGIIREGPHDAARSNAVHASNCNGYELAWLRVDVRSFLTSALYVPGGGQGANIHHNLLWDRGHAYANRHQGCRTLCMPHGGVGGKIHHNVIVTGRNRCIDGGKQNMEVFGNDVELLGHSTNCSAINMTGPGHRIHHNRIVAHGEHPHGIWGWRDNKIHDNKVDATSEMCISYEYGPLGAVGFRTNYDYDRYDGLELRDNVIVVRCEEFPDRGFWGQPSWLFWLADIGKQNRAVIADNTLVSVVYGRRRTVGIGLSSNSPNLLFRGNRILSNYQCVSFGTHRGDAQNVKWEGNTFLRLGKDPRFRTFGSARRNFDGNVLIDSRFEGGAGTDFQSDSYDHGDLAFQWHLDIRTAPGAKVSIRDRDGEEVFSGTADKDGRLRAPVTAVVVRYSRRKTTRDVRTPHLVIVAKDGKTASRKVTVDKAQVIDLRP